MNSKAWEKTTLATVASRTIGRTPPRNEARYWTTDTNERPFVSIRSMTSRIVSGGAEGVTAAAEEEGKAKRVPAGSLLLSFKLTLGRVGITDRDVFTNEAIAWVRPKPCVDRDFLALSLENLDWDALGSRAVKGKTLNSDSLDALPVTLPPIDEQRRIVDLLGAVGQAVDAADMQADALGSIRQNLLNHSLSGFERVQVRDLLTGISGGRSPAAEGRPPTAGEYGVLKVSAINELGFLPAQSKTVSDPEIFSTSMGVRAGDVLISRANTPERVGLACLVDDTYPNLFLSDKTLRLVPRAGVHPAALVAVLATSDARKQIQMSGTGSSGSMKNISQEDIRQLSVEWPEDYEVNSRIGAMDQSQIEVIAKLRATANSLRALRTEVLSSLLSGAHRIPETYDELMGA